MSQSMCRSVGLGALGALACCVLLACGGGGDGGDSPYPQTLVEVTPLEGSTAGGTLVTLIGSGFRSEAYRIAYIRFGEALVPDEDWQVIDDRTIRVVSPPGPLGSTVITLWDGKDVDNPLLVGGYRYRALALYAADGPQAAVPMLYRVDIDARHVSPIGPMGLPVAGLATRGDGAVFALEAGGTQRLLSLDTVSGQATPLALVRDDATGAPVDIVDVGFQGSRLLGRTAAGNIVEITVPLGRVVPVATTGPVGPGGGLAVERTGTVLVTPPANDELFRIETTTGGVSTGPRLSSPVARLAALGQELYALMPDPGAALPTRLVRVNPVNGVVELLIDLPAAAHSLTADV